MQGGPSGSTWCISKYWYAINTVDLFYSVSLLSNQKMHFFILITLFCTIVHCASWSPISCGEGSTPKQCYGEIKELGDATQLTVSPVSRHFFSVSFPGTCDGINEALLKIKGCESCKTAHNKHEDKSECEDVS